MRHCNITTLSRCFQDTVYDQELDESRNQIQDQDYQVNTRLRVHKDYTRLDVKPKSKSSVQSSKSISPSPDSLYPLYRAIIRRIESYVTQMGFLGWDFHCDFPDKYSTRYCQALELMLGPLYLTQARILFSLNYRRD